jgi:hypothetical protein
MTNQANAIVGCQLVGEFVDEADLPPNLPASRGEVVRPQVVASYLDLWARDDGSKEFTVLLKDGHVVAVRGQGLKHFPAAANGEGGSYGVIVRTGDEEVLVALFKVLEVVGIFHGEMRLDRKTA